MSERDRIEGLTEEILPALVARLRSSRLGEIEVATDGWRVRLRRDGSPRPRTTAPADVGVEAPATVPESNGSVARSPGVGYFSPAGDLLIGRSVQAGDLLGMVDVLGISHDVSAPDDGIISRVLADDGQAVEYGQTLAEIDPLSMSFEIDEPDPVVDR